MDDIIEGREVPFTDDEEKALQEYRDKWVVENPDHEKQLVKEMRRQFYSRDADPLFFKWQAGEATEQDWLDARKQVVENNPYPDTPIN